MPNAVSVRSRRVAAVWTSSSATTTPDGGCEEGPVYWSGRRGRTSTACERSASAVNGAADVMTHPFVQRMGQYIADVHIADNAFVNYGDAHMEERRPRSWCISMVSLRSYRC